MSHLLHIGSPVCSSSPSFSERRKDQESWADAFLPAKENTVRARHAVNKLAARMVFKFEPIIAVVPCRVPQSPAHRHRSSGGNRLMFQCLECHALKAFGSLAHTVQTIARHRANGSARNRRERVAADTAQTRKQRVLFELR